MLLTKCHSSLQKTNWDFATDDAVLITWNKTFSFLSSRLMVLCNHRYRLEIVFYKSTNHKSILYNELFCETDQRAVLLVLYHCKSVLESWRCWIVELLLLKTIYTMCCINAMLLILIHQINTLTLRAFIVFCILWCTCLRNIGANGLLRTRWPFFFFFGHLRDSIS